MTDDVLATVREDNETALSRLGSSKALYAKTAGDLVAEQVLRAAERARDQLSTVEAELDGYDPVTSGPLADHLREVDGATARAGALLGWSVISDVTLGQVVGFFVGDADPQTASTFRGVREETQVVRDDAVDLVAGLDDREAAREAADAVVERAYEDYVDTLEGMGVNPKDVC